MTRPLPRLRGSCQVNELYYGTPAGAQHCNGEPVHPRTFRPPPSSIRVSQIWAITVSHTEMLANLQGRHSLHRLSKIPRRQAHGDDERWSRTYPTLIRTYIRPLANACQDPPEEDSKITLAWLGAAPLPSRPRARSRLFSLGTSAKGSRAYGCRKPMPPGDIRELRPQRGHVAGPGPDLGRRRHLAAVAVARPSAGRGAAGGCCRSPRTRVARSLGAARSKPASGPATRGGSCRSSVP